MAIKFHALCGAVALFAATTGGACAQQTTEPSVANLAAISNANVMKEAQVHGAELDEKLRKLGVGAAAPDAGVSTGAASAARSADDDDAPVVQGVYGANGKLFVTLAYADGRRARDVQKGARVPGGYEVRELSSESVTLCRASRCTVIGFADKAITPPKPTTSPYPGIPLGGPGGVLPPVQ